MACERGGGALVLVGEVVVKGLSTRAHLRACTCQFPGASTKHMHVAVVAGCVPCLLGTLSRRASECTKCTRSPCGVGIAARRVQEDICKPAAPDVLLLLRHVCEDDAAGVDAVRRCVPPHIVLTLWCFIVAYTAQQSVKHHLCPSPPVTHCWHACTAKQSGSTLP